MRAACGWERGRSGQGKYNEEACRSGEVSAWGGGADGCGREAGRARRCGKEGAQSTVRGRWLGAGGWRGQAPEATRMCGGSNLRRITAEERQSANGGEGGSKTCGRHVDGSGAEAGKESTTRRQAGVGLSTHGGVGGQGLLGTLTSSMREGGVGAQWGGKHCEGHGVRHGKH